MRNRNKIILKRLTLTLAVYAPMLIGGVIVLSTKGPMKNSTLSLGSFITGFTGIIMIICKESPTTVYILKGKWAVIEGIIITALCWGIALFTAMSN